MFKELSFYKENKSRISIILILAIPKVPDSPSKPPTTPEPPLDSPIVIPKTGDVKVFIMMAVGIIMVGVGYWVTRKSKEDC